MPRLNRSLSGSCPTLSVRPISPSASGPLLSPLAFSLVEVMFSILILGVGLVAVASLFPIAGTIQRATVEDVTAMQVARNAESAVAARGISGPLGLDLMPDPFPTGTRFTPLLGGVVQPLPLRILD